jgi:hypothetical protein
MSTVLRARNAALGARAAGPHFANADEAVRAPRKRPSRGPLAPCAFAPENAPPALAVRAAGPQCRPWGRAPALRTVALRAAEATAISARPPIFIPPPALGARAAGPQFR